MKTIDMIRRLALLVLLLASPATLVSCGNGDGGEQVASGHVGPVGPTSPSGYYFEVTVTPHTITSGSDIAVTIRAYDQNGNAASGVPVNVAGTGMDPKDTFGSTSSTGYARWSIQMNSVVASYSYVTVSIEDKQLTVPVYIIPGTVSAV